MASLFLVPSSISLTEVGSSRRLDRSSSRGQFGDGPGQSDPIRSSLEESPKPTRFETTEKEEDVLSVIDANPAVIDNLPASKEETDTRIHLLRRLLPHTGWDLTVQDAFLDFTRQAANISMTDNPDRIEQMASLSKVLDDPRWKVSAPLDREVIDHIQSSLRSLKSTGREQMKFLYRTHGSPDEPREPHQGQKISLPSQQAGDQEHRSGVISRRPPQGDQQPEAPGELEQGSDRAREAITTALQELIQAIETSATIQERPKSISLHLMCIVLIPPITEVEQQLGGSSGTSSE